MAFAVSPHMPEWLDMKRSKKLIKHIFIYGLFLTTSLLPLVSLSADEALPDAAALLDKMSNAARSLNYDGVFIYRRGNQMNTMRLIHKAGEDAEKERLFSLSGRTREVIRDKEGVTCIFPDDESIMVERKRQKQFLSQQLPEPVQSIASFYSFLVVASDRVAGRDAWIVNIVPKDIYRYGYQLWIDKESNLLLKSELKTHAGSTVEQIIFTQMSVLETIDDAMLEPHLLGDNFKMVEHSYNQEPDQKSDNDWFVNWIPAGFQMKDQEKQTISQNNMPVNHMIYSDGLAMVSVFIEKLETVAGNTPGLSHRGGVNAFATFNNGYQVTVVGEVPSATVEQMAISVIRKNN